MLGSILGSEPKKVSQGDTQRLPPFKCARDTAHSAAFQSGLGLLWGTRGTLVLLLKLDLLAERLVF